MKKTSFVTSRKASTKTVGQNNETKTIVFLAEKVNQNHPKPLFFLHVLTEEINKEKHGVLKENMRTNHGFLRKT